MLKYHYSHINILDKVLYNQVKYMGYTMDGCCSRFIGFNFTFYACTVMKFAFIDVHQLSRIETKHLRQIYIGKISACFLGIS